MHVLSFEVLLETMALLSMNIMRKSGRVSAQIRNLYPNCLTLELEGENIEGLKAALYLTASFYEQEELILGGRVKFGLKRGELILSFENAQMKVKDRMLGAPLEVTLQREITRESSSEFQGGGSFSTSDKGILPGASLSTKTGEKIAEKETSITYRVFTTGNPESPSWNFVEVSRDNPLKGVLRDTQLGILTIRQRGVWLARVRFVFSIEDIYIKGSGGFWAEDIARNKMAVIERFIVKHLLQSKLHSPMSHGELVSRCGN